MLYLQHFYAISTNVPVVSACSVLFRGSEWRGLANPHGLASRVGTGTGTGTHIVTCLRPVPANTGGGLVAG
jgi:hypothetical protein